MLRKSVLRNWSGVERRGNDRAPGRIAALKVGVAVAVIVALGAAEAAALDRKGKQVLIEARIVEVSAGDRMKILDGPELKDFRLAGVVCPAPGEPMGNEARDFSRKLVSGQNLTIRVIPVEQSPILTGDILLSHGLQLSHQLLEQGLATWNHQEVPDLQLGEKEIQARSLRSGQWGVPMLADIPVLRRMFVQNDPKRVDALAGLILDLSPGDRARLDARLGGAALGGGVHSQTTIITTTESPGGQMIIEPRIIERRGGFDDDLGVRIGPDGVVIRGGDGDWGGTGDRHRRTNGDDRHGTGHDDDDDGPRFGGGSGSTDGPVGGSGGGGLVYASGGMFHRASCFGGGQPGPAMSRADAMNRGLAPCPKCRP